MVKTIKKGLVDSKNKILKSQQKAVKTIKIHHKRLLKSAKTHFKSKKVIAIAVLVVILIIIAIGLNIRSFGKPAAIVNNEKITLSELDAQYDLFFFLFGYPEEYKQSITKSDFLNTMINEKILIQEAIKKRISVLDNEAEEELNTIFASGSLSKEEFEIRLNQAGFSMDDLYAYYVKQMMVEKLLDEEFAVEITDLEASRYYNLNNDLYSPEPGQIRLSHILVETEKEAEVVLSKLKKGKNFAELAKEVSVGPSSEVGGDLGFVSKGQMVKEFEDASFKLNVNQLSGVVETQFGFHVIKRGPNRIPYDEVKESIKGLLKTEQQRSFLQGYIANLKKGAVIVNYLEEGSVVTGAVVSGDCYGDYGLTSDTIIFYHANWCPHCKNMMPIVKELESEGYNFYWAETSTGEGIEVVDACFRDVLQGGVPQFICAGNSEFKVGAMSKSELKELADSCN